MYIQCICYFSITKFLYITCTYTNVPQPKYRVHVWLWHEQVQARLLNRLYSNTMSANRSWTPVTGKLLPVKREILNDHDPFAITIWKDGEVVEHVPKSLRKITYFFFNYNGNVVFCEVAETMIESWSRAGNRSSLCVTGRIIQFSCLYKNGFGGMTQWP